MNVLPSTRRAFLGTMAGSAVALAARPSPAATPTAATTAAPRPAPPASRPRLALLGTIVTVHSHAQHFIDRFLTGYGWKGTWRRPDVDLVSLYIDQFPDGDLARDRARKHGVPLYPGIREALCCGGRTLAVDGVVIIGEHGRYPRNDRGQTLYPRHAWFKEVVRVFEDSGRAVPVFNDKHLSTTWAECAEMVTDARRLKFPLLAGSSLPVTWRLPSIDVPLGTPLRESVCACYGGVDSYDFHGLETAQCMSERRRGGESGIRSVHAVKGRRVWEMMDGRPTTQRLLASALSRSHTLPVDLGYPSGPITYAWARAAFDKPIAYFIEHRDGFRTSMFLLPIRDFNYAGLRADNDEVIACQMYLPMPGFSATTADFFNPLVHHIERLILEKQAPYPVERTLLTSGMTLAGVESLHRGEVEIATPEMAVAYALSDPAPLFWRE